MQSGYFTAKHHNMVDLNFGSWQPFFWVRGIGVLRNNVDDEGYTEVNQQPSAWYDINGWKCSDSLSLVIKSITLFDRIGGMWGRREGIFNPLCKLTRNNENILMIFEIKAIFFMNMKKQKSFWKNSNYPGNYRYGSGTTRIAL